MTEGRRTRDGGILAEVTGLVATEETLGLDFGGGTTGELLVEADDSLHAQSVRSSANGLSITQDVSSFVRADSPFTRRGPD